MLGVPSSSLMTQMPRSLMTLGEFDRTLGSLKAASAFLKISESVYKESRIHRSSAAGFVQMSGYLYF